MYVLALKSDASIAWLWFICMTKFAGLIISLYKGWTMIIRLSEIDHPKLKKRLIQHKILVSH